MADSTVTRRNRPFFLAPFFRNVLAVILLVLVLIGGYLWSLYPMNRGLLRLPELERPVLLWRDTYGVPIIASQSQSDAWFSLGYVHAQDRLWLMEIVRMAAWGELTSLMGEEAVPLDRWYRRIGFYRNSIHMAAEISDESYTSLHRYVSGINAYLKAHPFRIPPEFILSKYKPYPWKVEDVLAIGSMLTWLSQPCSLFYPPGPNTFGDISLEHLPEGLAFLVSPLIVERKASSASGMQVRMSWGSTFPTVWHEAGVTVAGRNLRRIWTIPGWPLPFAGAMRDTAIAVLTTDSAVSPWEEMSDYETEDTILEFIGHRYSILVVDTVYIRDGRSLAGKVAGARSVYGTSGSMRFTRSFIEKQIRLLFDYTDSPSDSGGISIFPGEVRETEENSTVMEELIIPVDMHSGHSSRWIVPRRFGILTFFGWSHYTWKSGLSVAVPGCRFITDTRAPAAMVTFRANAVWAMLPTGQSGVPGSLHSFDQNDDWIKGTVKPRSLTIPLKKRSCVLVPLYPIDN